MRSSNEVAEIIAQVESQGFEQLRAKARERYSQIYADDAYRATLITALAPEIDTRIPMPSRRPNAAAFDTQGILRRSLSFHVEPGSERKKDERKADKLELFFAH